MRYSAIIELDVDVHGKRVTVAEMRDDVLPNALEDCLLVRFADSCLDQLAQMGINADGVTFNIVDIEVDKR